MIEFRGISKRYAEGAVLALDNVSLSIKQGEFVAIIGPSGSGKSTMMHVMGLLDRPDSGSYFFMGRDVSTMSDDELARLRNRMMGFVFQQFHLLPRLSAVGNAALPLIYAGRGGRKETAAAKLAQVGLGHRTSHRPNQLSGGEQQRVAIARALVNDPVFIMADEPTGNLDSKSEQEIVAILENLNRDGKTIIMVTHEKEIADHARRVVQMRDGRIVSDVTRDEPGGAMEHGAHGSQKESQWDGIGWQAGPGDHFRQAFHALVAHKMRSFLSMLGILIGVGAVIATMAVTAGAKESIRKTIASLGSNLLFVHPAARQSQGVRLEAGLVTRLTLDDARAMGELPSIRSMTPVVWGRGQLVHGNKNWNSSIQGTGTAWPLMHDAVPKIGRFFTEREIVDREKVAVIGATVVRELFGDVNPVGQTILANRVRIKVIGIFPPKGARGFRDQDDIVMIPVTTAMRRIIGTDYINGVDVEVRDSALIEQAQTEIKNLMARRRMLKDPEDCGVTIRNMTEMQAALGASTKIMGWLLGSIAVISLLVGGIGIMNIMLVAVTERTREIGLRKAMGARAGDIMKQFLIEAVVMTSVGGLIGVAAGCGGAMLVAKLAEMPVRISPASIALALVFSAAVGVLFGLWPARRASLLNPIEALRYE